MKRFILGLLLCIASFAALAADPCIVWQNDKQSAVINVTTATTTSLVAAVGGKAVYVCDWGMTISQVVTTANTIKFVYGTGATCGTGTTDLTGPIGAGGVTAAPPIYVVSSSTGTTFTAPMGNALCVTTTIGGSASFAGWVTYIQR